MCSTRLPHHLHHGDQYAYITTVALTTRRQHMTGHLLSRGKHGIPLIETGTGETAENPQNTL